MIDNLRKDGDLFSADALEQALKVTKKSIKYQGNMNIFERAISHLAEIFVPLLPAIIVGGLILLLGIRITFYSKTISLRNIVNKD